MIQGGGEVPEAQVSTVVDVIDATATETTVADPPQGKTVTWDAGVVDGSG